MSSKSLAYVIGTVLLFCMACTNEVKLNQQNIDNILGFVHHDCLAIKNNTLSEGYVINILNPDSKNTILKAKIKSKHYDQNCIVLQKDRKEENLNSGLFFYQIDLDGDKILSPSLAIAHQSIQVKKQNEQTLLDLNSDTEFEFVNTCTTTEGILFTLWKGTPFKSDQLWRGYYYLAYDMEPSCPNLE